MIVGLFVCLFVFLKTNKQIIRMLSGSQRKQPMFREVAALAQQCLSNERRNSILMTCTTQILVVLLIG